MRDFEEKLVSYLRFAQAAVPHMKRAGWGRIVNISGGAGRSRGTQISAGARYAGAGVRPRHARRSASAAIPLLDGAGDVVLQV